MKISFSSLIFTFLVFFFSLQCFVSSSIIQDSCQQAAKSSPNVKYDFCVASLSSSFGGQTATLEGLTSIAVDLTISKATKIGAYASRLSKKRKYNEPTKNALKDCSTSYSDAKASLTEASSAIKAKAYGTANIKLSAAMDASSNCEGGFKEAGGGSSPLTNENKFYYESIAIPLAFTNMLH